MNSHNLNYNHHSQITATFQQEKQKWENAINSYEGPDPLDLWYNFICWYEQNNHLDHERLFETALGKCLSTYECEQHYNQDPRMVKLWMKYIDLKPNPLNLYQVLYQRGIGTHCSIFYIGWAHYYDSANAFKQAESVYNLGFQANAQPYNVLEQAHKNFCMSFAQRMLYDDQQSKKRTVSHLHDQRQQITALKPSPSIAPNGSNDFASAANQPISYGPQNNNLQSEYCEQQPPANKRFRHVDANRAYDTNCNSSNQTIQVNEPVNSTLNRCDLIKSNSDNLNSSNSSAACLIASSLNSVYSGGEEQCTNEYSNYSYNEDALNESSEYDETVTALPYAAATSNFTEALPAEMIDEALKSINLPSNFVYSAKNHFEPWVGALFLDESDVNKICKYPRHLVYPGNGCEYSLEEIRARNYTKAIEAIKEQNRQREQLVLEQQRAKQQLRMEQDQRLKIERERQMKLEQERQLKLEQERQLKLEQEQQLRIQMERNRLSELKEKERERIRVEMERAKAAEEEAECIRLVAQQKLQTQQQHFHQQQQQQHHHPYYRQEQSMYNNYGTYSPTNHTNHSTLGYRPQQQATQQQYYNQNRSSQSQLAPMHRKSLDQNEIYKPPCVQQSTPHVPATTQQQRPVQMQYQNANYHYQQPPQTPSTAQFDSQYQQPLQQAQVHTKPANKTSFTTTNTVSMNSYVDDIEEQIEASTIVLENGSSKPQKITIKFRKENNVTTATTSFTDSNSVPSSELSPIAVKPPKTKRSKKSKNTSKQEHAYTTNDSASQYSPNYDDEFNDSLSNVQSSSNDSYSIPTASITNSTKTKKSASNSKRPKYEPSYLQNDESYSNSEFTALYGKYSNETDENTANGTTTRNVRFNFAGATSTPIRNNNNNNNNHYYQQSSQYSSPCTSAKPTYKSNDSSSKSSTPRNTYKTLKKCTSNTSLLNHTLLNENDDSMTSFSMVEPNSFFETENDDELRQQRRDKALKTIEQHFKKEHIDPFNSELCKAFLTKIGFPSREHTNYYKLVNTLLSKLSNTKQVTIGDVRFNIEKEVGKGAYGNVYRAVNSNTGDIVALKYQKPPNTWELYICTEVSQRIQDPHLLPGFMDISSAIVAPNASIFVSEFSQYGSLLDINNRIRQSTTKVMHESLVMHFTSQILNIIHHLHSCKIIHGDIKPDNFLLMKIPNTNSNVPTLRLIDFGCAIDMNFFEPNIQFKKMIQTDGFTCPEMLEGRHWSYQTDIFCIAGTVHVMLFGDYMQLVNKFNQYDIKQKLPRYLKKHIWTEFFTKFLNIKDAHQLPNLLDMKEKIDNEVYGMESELQSQIRTLSNILHKR